MMRVPPQDARVPPCRYALSVYLMYALLAFALVYLYETSHCDAELEPVYWSSLDEGKQFNWTSYQYDIFAVKNSKTATIFGGVYGPKVALPHAFSWLPCLHALMVTSPCVHRRPTPACTCSRALTARPTT